MFNIILMKKLPRILRFDPNIMKNEAITPTIDSKTVPIDIIHDVSIILQIIKKSSSLRHFLSHHTYLLAVRPI